MPFKYMGAVMFGNGVSGVLMNSVRAILQAILPGKDNLYIVALLFFIIAAFILFVCGCLHSVLFSSEFFMYFKN